MAREADELVPIERAILAQDCILDRDVIESRNGYRKASAAALVGTGTNQAASRFRPSNTSAKNVAAIGGTLYTVTDPSSEILKDGTVAALAGAPHFGTGANVAMAQLGTYLYCAPDEGGAWRRVKSDFTVESISPLSKITGAVASTSTPSQVIYSAHTVTGNGTGAVLDTNYLSSGWYRLTSATPQGYINITLNTAVDYTGHAWILFFVCPLSRTSGGTYPIDISVGDNAGNFFSVGTITSTVTNGGANAIYLNISSVPSSIRGAIKQIRFKDTNTSTETQMAVYGHIPIPANAGTSNVQYQVAYFNSSTLQESPLSDDVKTSSGAVLSLTPFTLGGYPALYTTSGSFYYNSGVVSDPNPISSAVYNYAPFGTISGPTASDLVPLVSIAAPSTVATGTGSGQADYIRLYKITDNGRRLVKAVANPGAGNTATLVDDLGVAVLSNASYKSTGTPPSATALAGMAGRLIAGGAPTTPNRLYISSYLPFTQSNDPFPQFPEIAVEDADGWSFDIAPSPSEGILALVAGDALYVLTNRACYVMVDLTPNAFPYQIFDRGVIGRRACCWAENRLFWAADDGIYEAANRSSTVEMSQEIRRFYREWFAPDSTTVVCYQGRKLYAWCGTRFIRFDFVTNRWTCGVTAHSMQAAVMWRDPTGTIQNMWMLDSTRNLMRWQPSGVVGSANAATTDEGTAISAWFYKTGYSFSTVKTRLRKFFSTATNPVIVQVNATSVDAGRKEVFDAGNHEHALHADETGYQRRLALQGVSGAQLTRLLWEVEPVSAEGAENA